MKFDDEICNGVSCPECPFNEGEDGCLLAKRLDEIEITSEPCADAVPSAQPEIIRCKDCKKYDIHDHRCKHWNHGVVVMDWCSKAERR